MMLGGSYRIVTRKTCTSCSKMVKEGGLLKNGSLQSCYSAVDRSTQPFQYKAGGVQGQVG